MTFHSNFLIIAPLLLDGKKEVVPICERNLTLILNSALDFLEQKIEQLKGPEIEIPLIFNPHSKRYNLFHQFVEPKIRPRNVRQDLVKLNSYFQANRP